MPDLRSEQVNEIIFKGSEKLLLHWVEEYKKDPKVVINCFLKFESIRMSICLITFWARKNAVTIDKDFSDYVNKLNLEERWKPVLNKFLVILWGCIK